jgi:hypothetical protein
LRVLSYCAAVATLAACGGGGGDAAPANSVVEGAYAGTLTGSTSSSFELLMLDGGEYWAVYGTQTASQFLVAGFIQGSGTSSNGTFTSNNARDFGVAPAMAGTLSATYTSTPTITGSVIAAGGTIGFSGGAIAGSTYNYNTPATVAAVSGNWSLGALTGETIALNIAGTGAFTAMSSGGCSMTGTIGPRASGRNVYSVSLTFGGAPCLLPGTTTTGIALTYPLTGGSNQLIVAVRDGTRTYGTAAFGTR